MASQIFFQEDIFHVIDGIGKMDSEDDSFVSA